MRRRSRSKKGRRKKKSGRLLLRAAQSEKVFTLIAIRAATRHALPFPRRSGIRIAGAGQRRTFGFHQKRRNRSSFASHFTIAKSKKRCRASGRKESKRERERSDDGDEEGETKKRSVRLCRGARRALSIPRRRGASLQSDAPRGRGARRGVSDKPRKAFADLLSKRSTESSLSIGKGSVEYRRRKKLADGDWKKQKARHQNAFQNSQRPARDTVAPVRRGFVMALVCIVGEKAKGGFGALEAGEEKGM